MNDEKNVDNTTPKPENANVPLETPNVTVEGPVKPVPPMTGMDHKDHKKLILIVVIMVLTLIIGVLGFNYKFNKKAIFVSSTTKLQDHLSYLSEPVTSISNKKRENYTTTGKMKVQLQSDLLVQLATLGEEYQAYQTLIENMSRTENTYAYQLDSKNKKMKFELNSKLGNEDLFHIVYMNQDKTNYLLLKGIFNQYINAGEYDIFEALENGMTAENREYIVNFIIDSVKKNIKSEYLVKESAKITVDGKKKSATKVSFVIDQHNTSEILVAVVKEIKKDSKANKIMNSISEEFKNYNPKVEKNTASSGEMLISSYTNSITGSLMQYEFTNNMKKTEYTDASSSSIRYVIGKNDSIEVVNNGKVMALASIDKNDNGYTMTFKDQNNKKIGTLVGKKEDQTVSYTLKMNVEGMDATLNFDLTQKESNDATKTNFNFGLQVSANGMKAIDMKITSDATTVDKVNIKQDGDINKAVSSDLLTQEDMTTIQNGIMSIMTKLMTTK